MMTSHHSTSTTAFTAFAAFGAFWGTWGASVPRLRTQTGIDDGQLGIALLFIGAGALPAMLLAGRAVDRWGQTTAALALLALGGSGVAVAVLATDYVGLCIGLLLVGVSSGATDVAMNAAAGRAEQVSGKPIITHAHAVFSVFVVLFSLGTGLLGGSGKAVVVPFVLVGVLSAAASLLLLTGNRPRPLNNEPVQLEPAAQPGLNLLPLLLIGVLGALAFASENAHQSGGAVFFEDVLATGPGVSAMAPAVFAGVVAVTRFSIGSLTSRHAQTILVAGSAAAAAGAFLLAGSSTLGSAITGLVLAAGGTAVLFPTLMGVVSRSVEESRRGRATSLLASVSYLGFLLGPVYVGAWSEFDGLRSAMVAVAALGVALLVLVPVILRINRSQTKLSA